MKDELPLIRIKARYQTVQILPMENYHDLIQVQNNVFQKDLILYNLESKPGGLSQRQTCPLEIHYKGVLIF